MTAPAPTPTPSAPVVAQINWSGLFGIVKASFTGIVQEVEEVSEEVLAQVRAEIGGKFWAQYNANPNEVLAHFQFFIFGIDIKESQLNGFFSLLFGPNPNPPAAPAAAPTPAVPTSLPTGSTQS
jgi:hypothetical protein